MTITFLRLYFVFLSSVVGYYIGLLLGDFNVAWGIGGLAAGFLVLAVIILIEMGMRRFSMRNLSKH